MMTQSHPARVRGLKRRNGASPRGSILVAPRAGAWIETFTMPHFAAIMESHPARVRGLKPLTAVKGDPQGMSHPARVRGLKHYMA